MPDWPALTPLAVSVVAVVISALALFFDLGRLLSGRGM
jgi:hypothetical protein